MSESYVSQREIARKAGVSVSAVSLALRNHPKVSAAQREKIQRVAREMGYRSDPVVVQLMEHLRKARSKRQISTLAVLVPEIKSSQLPGTFINEVIEGARKQAKEAGFRLDLFFPEELEITPKRLRTILLSRGINGIMVAPFASGPGEMKFDFSGFSAATAGYSLVSPLLHRSCPNYLQMLDEILEAILTRGYRRIGLVLHYKEGGIGHKLFSSSYLFYQAHIPADQRIPILPKGQISEAKLAAWVSAYKPEVIVGPGFVFSMLKRINLKIPDDLGFASLDICDPPKEVAGANHRYRLVGSEAIKLLLSQIHLNLTGLPESPKVVLVDSHFRPGFSLADDFRPADGTKRRCQPPRFREDMPLKAETGLIEEND